MGCGLFWGRGGAEQCWGLLHFGVPAGKTGRLIVLADVLTIGGFGGSWVYSWGGQGALLGSPAI